MVHARDQSKPEPSSLRKWLQETECVMKFQGRHISDKACAHFLLRKEVSFLQVVSSFGWSHAFRGGGGVGMRLPRILSAHLAHTLLQGPERASVQGEVQCFPLSSRWQTAFLGSLRVCSWCTLPWGLDKSFIPVRHRPAASSFLCGFHLHSDASLDVKYPDPVTLVLPGWHHLYFHSVQCLLHGDVSCFPTTAKGEISMEAFDSCSYWNCLIGGLCALQHSSLR